MPLKVSTFPLCFFFIRGIICCLKLHETIESSPFTRNFFCYEAISLKEANVLVLWGNITKKIAQVADDSAHIMMSNHYIIHMAGCQHLVDDTILTQVPINKVVFTCSQKTWQPKTLISEARQCLRA